MGEPDPAHISTSYAERSNLSIRMGLRRFTQLTNAFSKKVKNHVHSLAIYFMHYNFVRIHQSLRATPAMAAGVTNRLWELDDMVRVLEAWETEQEKAAIRATVAGKPQNPGGQENFANCPTTSCPNTPDFVISMATLDRYMAWRGPLNSEHSSVIAGPAQEIFS
jgi:hypothetical protein